jgi:hypothetical protein
VSLQQIVEELHVELVVLHDHHGLRHARPSEIDAVPAIRVRCRVVAGSKTCDSAINGSGYWCGGFEVPARMQQARIGTSNPKNHTRVISLLVSL